MSDYIHEDLLFPILKLMPVKTLLQWRSVCNSWRQLIDSKAFILDHLAVQSSRIIVQNQSLEYGLLDPSTLPLYDTLTGPDGVPRDDLHPFVISSVHGVVFLYGDADFVLWNPSIRHSISIPFPENQTRNGDLHFCGFWIDPSTSDFKIVIVNFSQCNICLFSSRKEVWKETAMAEELGSDIVDSVQIVGVNSVLIEGVTHWIAAIDEHCENHVVVFFDFGQDKFGAIELPELPTKSHSNPMPDKNICKWKGLLSFVQLHEESQKCDLWVMQNGSWSKMSSFSVMNGIIEVIHVWEDWGRVLAGNGEELLLYDPKDGCIPLGFDMQAAGFSFAIDFVESLVFPYRKCISSGSL